MTATRRIVVRDTVVEPGSRVTLDLIAGQLYTHEPISVPVHVINGRRPGPVLFLSAAIHGDELNGIEIVRRVLRQPALARLRGALIAVPIVNVLGVVHQSRYLPDRRDLNRCFPGSESGSLAARLAHLFMEEVVSKAAYGIDLHTGSLHRSNLPHLRARLDDAEVLRLARAFGTPVALNADWRDGSLRQAASERGIRMLLYEGGEALRFDELAIRAGERGVMNVLHALEMLPPGRQRRAPDDPYVAHSSSWLRAAAGGIFRAATTLGARVRAGDVLGLIADPFGEDERAVVAPADGVVIGRTNLPLVHEGDALFHVARFDRPGAAARAIAAASDDLDDEVEAPPPETP
jgi:uncharacterized protein